MSVENQGYRIAQLRIARGMSQVDLAKALGVAQPTIANWEKGAKRPASAKLAKVAEYFNVSTDYLLGTNKDSEAPDLKEVLKSGLTYGGQELDASDLAIIEDVIKGMLKRKGHDL
ncbi:helix-turn-helix transcriptional regulator [Abiotrophia defectiva]|uniref:helix-turn-helix domain-containing protein n=1 Tax=Abiotrophia defectiva TaxID=46125 RepID=UPI0028EBE701|nr:helix-turn-helix transcriptional regulator [Abiotrophia defectiva]